MAGDVTLGRLQAITRFLVQRDALTENERKAAEAVFAQQRSRQKLYLAALAQHKMEAITNLMRAIDQSAGYLTDPVYLSALRGDPEELRKTVTLLIKMQEHDVGFLRDLTGSDAEKYGMPTDAAKTLQDVSDQAIEVTRDRVGSLSTGQRRDLQSMLRVVLTAAAGAVADERKAVTRAQEITQRRQSTVAALHGDTVSDGNDVTVGP